MSVPTQEEILDAFKLFDTNSYEYIERSELKRVLMEFGSVLDEDKVLLFK